MMDPLPIRILAAVEKASTPPRSISDLAQSSLGVQEYGSSDSGAVEKIYLPRYDAIEPLYSSIYIIFKCKDDCKTVVTKDSIKEMMKFTASAVDDPMWERTCIRLEGMSSFDGAHCATDSYVNLTHFVEPLIEMATDAMI